MNQHRLIYMLIAALVSLAIPTVIYLKVRFPQPLTAAEASVMNVSPAGPSYSPKLWQPATVQLPITAQKIAPPVFKTAGGASAPRPMPAQRKKPQISISVSDSND
jgi:hypothetical protein